MDKKEVLEFITKNPIAFVATAESNKPHVRAFGTYKADENGIIFSMQSDKDVYKQIVANPETEICYYADGVQIRVKGQIETARLGFESPEPYAAITVLQIAATGYESDLSMAMLDKVFKRQANSSRVVSHHSRPGITVPSQDNRKTT